jgi:hypothetical protein
MVDVGILGPVRLFYVRPNGIYIAIFTVHFVVIWYTFSRFGRLYRDKSGNPGVYTSSKSTFGCGQGDQMNFKAGQNVAQPIVCKIRY